MVNPARAKTKKITLALPPEASQGVNVVEFYDNVAHIMGMDPDPLTYDCKKMNVAINIQANIFSYLDMHFGKDSIGMIWCCYGPKAYEGLPDDTIEIEHGFFVKDGRPAPLLPLKKRFSIKQGGMKNEAAVKH